MRRLGIVLVFLTVLATAVVGGHLYLAKRLVLDSQLSPSLEATLLWAIGLFASTLVLQPITERTLPTRVASFIALASIFMDGIRFFPYCSARLLGLDLAAARCSTRRRRSRRRRCESSSRANRGWNRPERKLRWSQIRAAPAFGAACGGHPGPLATQPRRFPDRSDQRHPHRSDLRSTFRSGCSGPLQCATG